MCSVVVLRRPDNAWPFLLASNRDERHDRPWKPPGRHWPDRQDIVAGLDLLAGGSWQGINTHGVVAAILNREGTLGPATGKRSRGELVLDALDYADAADAASALTAIDGNAYRPFNLLVADNRDAFLLSHRGAATVGIEPLPEGLSMITALDRDDPRSPRIRFSRPLFLAATPPDPETGDWSGWESLLASRSVETNAGPTGALFIEGQPPSDPGRFGTVSSSLIGLPAADRTDLAPVWRFTGGPGQWRNVELPEASGKIAV